MIDDALLARLDSPNLKVDKVWSKEADVRIKAYNRGEVETASVDYAFARHQKS